MKFLKALKGAFPKLQLSEYLAEQNDEEIVKMCEVMNECDSTSDKYLSTQLLCQINEPEDKNSFMFELLEECRADIQNSELPSLIPCYAFQNIPRTDMSLYAQDTITEAHFGGDEEIVTYSSNDRVKVWNLQDTKIPVQTGVKLETVSKVVYIKDSVSIILGDKADGMYIHDWKTSELNKIDTGNVKGVIISNSVPKDGKYVFVLCLDENKGTVIKINVELKQIEKIIAVKTKFTSNDVTMKVTDSVNYLVFQIRCTDKEREILMSTEKKNNLNVNEGFYKYSHLDVNKGSTELVPVNRQRTKVCDSPTSRYSWARASSRYK